MRFQTISLAIFATAQLGLAAPTSGAADSIIHRLVAREESFAECYQDCRRRFFEKQKPGKKERFDMNAQSSCYYECERRKCAPSDLMDFAQNYDSNGYWKIPQ